MYFSIEQVSILLLIAAVVAMFARRLRFPYTVGLVITGGALALLPFAFEIALTKEMIFTAFLPPLVFEAAFYLKWHELRKDFVPVFVLATAGVLLSGSLIAVGLHGFLHWKWVSAFLFGALISATDPVSVLATFKEAGVRGRLRLLVESESLFNDGTAAVAFAIVFSVAQGGAFSGASVAEQFVTVSLGGILCGLLVGGAMLLLAGRTEDHLVEVTFTTVAAYGSFLFAEHFHASGVLATLTAGLLFGNIGPRGAISSKGREAVQLFWEYAAFVVNSLIFILIGMRETHQNFQSVWFSIGTAIVLVLLSRAVTVYFLCRLFNRSAWKIDMRHQHVLFWGGMRGALALALVLGLPDEIPHSGEMATVAFAVVAFSVLVQGLTMTPLLRKLGEIKQEES